MFTRHVSFTARHAMRALRERWLGDAPLQSLADALVGGHCAVCGSAGAALCAACAEHFAAIEGDRWRCAGCGHRLALSRSASLHGEAALGDSRCGACASDPPAFDRTICAADYAPPLEALIIALKFHRRAETAIVFARLLERAVRARSPLEFDTLVPVPLSAQRLAERGYNQAERIAKALASRLRLPCHDDFLLRTRSSAPVSGMKPDQRAASVKRAFVAPMSLVGQSIGLVDDVMTTGATMREAARALKAAGAARVIALVALRTART